MDNYPLNNVESTKIEIVPCKNVEQSNHLLTEKETKFLGHIGDSSSESCRSKENDQTELPPVPFLKLFQYASVVDKLLIGVGCVIASVSGLVMPTVMVLFGRLIDKFVDFMRYLENKMMETYKTLESNSTIISNLTTPNETYSFDEFASAFKEESIKLSLYIGAVGLSLLLLHYITVSCLSISAENQILQIKHLFIKSILKQDIGWFDTNETGDFSSRVTTDLLRVREGIGEKISMCLYFSSSSVLCLICALYYGWKLTLVILSVMPVLVISTAIMAKIQAKVSVSELSAYGKAGAVAEEVLSSIRTVVAFGGEKKEIERYEKNLIAAKKSGIKKGLLTSVGVSLVWFCIYASYALGFWYGVKLILESRAEANNEYTAGTLLTVFFSVLTAAMNVGQISPYVEAFGTARGAAAKIFHIMHRIPSIDSSSKLGKRPSDLKGKVQLENIYFNYPSRPDVKILQGLSIEGSIGETVALVGPSGCGKSTVIQLLQRFYDPVEGKVLLDGKDIRELNVGWLRKRIGVVGQEPSLFATSIAENIRHGYSKATNEDIEEAAKAANAHDFIMKLPQKYDTVVGERGAQLSGGQKQRIAIARALVRNPRILLLDEATSALDMESESIVQAALDQAREGRTTFVVAHRLSTIKNADKIIVINKGVVEETGNHMELMEKKGLYHQLVVTQQAEGIEDINENEEPPANRRQPDVWIRQQSTVSATSLSSEESMPSHRIYNFPIKDTILEEDTEELEDKDVSPSQIRLLKLIGKDWFFVFIGVTCSLIMGLSFPFYGILFGEIMGALGSNDNEEVRSNTSWFSLLFVIMGIVTGVASFLQTFMFSIAGEKLTMRLRKMVFKTMIQQDMAWFDDPKNRTGALCSRLSSDASQVQGATGSRLATICQAVVTLVAAFVLAIYYNYKVGLVTLCFVPLVIIATFFESRIISGHMLKDKDVMENANRIAVEAIENIRTVASLHQEKAFSDAYIDALGKMHSKVKRRSHIRGITFGFAQSIPCFAYSISMYYGSILVAKKELTFTDLFKILEGIILGTMMIGQAVAFAPDYQKARISAVRIFKLLDLQTKIDAFSTTGKFQRSVNGTVEFHNVSFNYPSRSEVKVLRGINFSVEQGQTIALVGSSGCGKSTCVQLLQRYYDVLKGKVMVDRTDIRDFNVAWLRSQIGVVSQEPVLFSYSIAENIAYGDNFRPVPMTEIKEAAKKANIHNFVSSLPDGYNTDVGDRGTQLSGGQKQRIAIARALIRNPKLLLLDEATSALDTESEKVVQEALDQARVGRTCIIIAHRLSTIQNADKILVIHKGRVVEQGTHQQLLSLKGFYHKLQSIQ